MVNLVVRLLYQYTYDYILRYFWPSARRQRYSGPSAGRQRRLPSPPRTVVFVVIANALFPGRTSSIKDIKNNYVLLLMYQYKYSTHTVFCVMLVLPRDANADFLHFLVL